MKSMFAFVACLAVAGTSMAAPGYSTVNPPPGVELNHAQILNLIYGGSFNQSGNDFNNGTVTATRVADNGLGVAVLATLPLILEELGIELASNLVLLGTTRSFGRGDLASRAFRRARHRRQRRRARQPRPR